MTYRVVSWVKLMKINYYFVVIEGDREDKTVTYGERTMTWWICSSSAVIQPGFYSTCGYSRDWLRICQTMTRFLPAPRKTVFPSLLCSLVCSHDWILATGKWAEVWPMKQSHMQPTHYWMERLLGTQRKAEARREEDRIPESLPTSELPSRTTKLDWVKNKLLFVGPLKFEDLLELLVYPHSCPVPNPVIWSYQVFHKSSHHLELLGLPTSATHPIFCGILFLNTHETCIFGYLKLYVLMKRKF